MATLRAPMGLAAPLGAMMARPIKISIRHRLAGRRPALPHRRPAARLVVAAATDSPATSPTTATACVEAGLLRFESGDAVGALSLFQRAMMLRPNDDEARAALYNSACALTKLQRWEEAADAVVSAVNDYNLKLIVAIRDPDLALLREKREWNKALSRAAGGITNSSYVKLRAEAKAPFRLTRIFLFGALAAGAGVGLIIITARLVAAARGVEGAPEMAETVKNFAINAGALGALGFLVYRDLSGQAKDAVIVEREETLATLQVTLGPGRTVPLAAFRGTTRPVIITGSKGQIARTMAAAAPFREDLRLRGVSIVPVVLADEDPGEKLRRLKAELAAEAGESAAGGFGGAAAADKPAGFAADKKGPRAGAEVPEVGPDGAVAKTDQRWQLEAAGVGEWAAWVREQAKVAGVASPGDSYYVQVQLDGSVRASGTGCPPWRQFLDDIPPLDDVRTKFTDGAGVA